MFVFSSRITGVQATPPAISLSPTPPPASAPYLRRQRHARRQTVPALDARLHLRQRQWLVVLRVLVLLDVVRRRRVQRRRRRGGHRARAQQGRERRLGPLPMLRDIQSLKV